MCFIARNDVFDPGAAAGNDARLGVAAWAIFRDAQAQTLRRESNRSCADELPAGSIDGFAGVDLVHCCLR
jgi:hypothetical protein